MSIPGSEIDDDDFDEGFVCEDEEELGFDYHLPMEAHLDPSPSPHATPHAQHRTETPATATGKRSRRIRIRPMPPGISAKFPNAVSIVITNANGKQLILVSK